MSHKYLFGADPELFIRNTKNNRFISAHDIIPGTKKEPFKVARGAVQRDGVAAEFNIDPAPTFDEFKFNIDTVVAQLTEMVKDHNPNYELVALPTAKFGPKYFENLPEESKELGCDPDFNAINGLENPRPDPNGKPFRTGGGHFHLGWTKDADVSDIGHIRDCRVVINNIHRVMASFETRWDKDTKRRNLYGKPYSYRPKHFGVEYRYLSNAWVFNEDAMRFMFNVGLNTLIGLDRAILDKKQAIGQNIPDLPESIIGDYYKRYGYAMAIQRVINN